jgi:uncharacterized protein (TIGR00369 family)
LAPLPLGKWVFSRIVGFLAPYTGTMGALVEQLEPGYARVRLRDRRRVRNHLRSVHAIALANLAELASGLALVAALPDDARGIPVSLRIDYLKKARGTLLAEGRTAPPDAAGAGEHLAEAVVRDESGDVVARASVTWKIGPAPAARPPAPALAR